MKVEEKPTPKPVSDQVLVNIDASPVNPSDIAFIRGMYNVKKNLPAIPGFEGTGIVVDTGNQNDAKALLGKRVSCFCQKDNDGTWADYFLASVSECFPVKKQMDRFQSACFFINPFTAYALYELCKNKNAKAIIQSAASGQVGKFFRYFAKNDNIPVINIVRKEKHIGELLAEGEKYVLDSTSPDFYENLYKLSHELYVNVAIDAVGGEFTGKLIKCLPDYSDVILFGGLSGTYISDIDPLEIIFHKKSLIGFNLNEWFKKHNRVEQLKISDKLQDLFISEKLITKIKDHYDLSDVKSAFKHYISDMSGGKVLFVPK